MKRSNETLLSSRSLFILDLDGVVYAGDQEVTGAAKAIARFREAGKQVAFLTNNSSRHPERVAQKLEKLGIPCRLADVMTSGLAAAVMIKRQHLDRGHGTFVLGSADLRALVEAHGTPVVDAEKCGAVLVGFDANMNLATLVDPMRAVLRGATFIACNREANFPGANGLLQPGCGGVVAALEGATLKRADIEVGKPSPFMLDVLLETLGRTRSDAIYFGDTLDSDIGLARQASIPGVWLNGADQPRHTRATEHERPDLIAADLAAIAAMLP